MKILTIQEAEEEKFPNILNSIVKVKYTIQLYMAEENIKNGSTVFEAKEVRQAQEKADNFDPNVAAADEIQELSMNNVWTIYFVYYFTLSYILKNVCFTYNRPRKEIRTSIIHRTPRILPTPNSEQEKLLKW